MSQSAQNPIITVRNERLEDIEAIHKINTDAFKNDGEAALVDRLRKCCPDFISLVAEFNGDLVGHLLFTPATLTLPDGQDISGMGLAPLAVKPEFQHQGFGSRLCEVGLAHMAASGTTFVVVLGHPGYYPRFGFEPAYTKGITCAYDDVPPEAFMIRIFDPEKMKAVSGVVHYHPEFDSVT